jgi:hypothetical protein
MRVPIVSLLALLLLLSFGACKKYSDEPGKSDPRLTRSYCNDPEAVNFNRDFPGTANNAVCVFPAEAYEGNYRYDDSIYDGAFKLLRTQTINFSVSASDRLRFTLNGFCPAGPAPIAFTTSRTLRADADTTALIGQILCRPTDTVSGYLSMSPFDSTRISFNLTVVSDTGTVFHQGTAYRQ